jgi:diacylglycerol kinase family enzyme
MRPRAIDIGRLVASPDVTRYFAVAGGCGFDAEVMFRTSSAAKRTWGSGAYFATAIRMAMAMPRTEVRVEVDGAVLEREAAVVLLANCGTILPIGHAFAPHIAVDDGLLDVIVLNARTFLGAGRIAWALALGDSSRHPDIQFLRGRTVRIASEPGMAAQADGELCGRTPLSAELLVGGLTVLAPRAR